MLQRQPIKKKHCKCSPDCKLYPTMSCQGYNYNHLPEDLKEKAGTKRKVQIKNRNKRVALSSKINAYQRKVDGSDDNLLDLWFKSKMYTSPRICENCHKDLSNLNDNDWKGCQHHVLEKSVFKSVKTNPLNHLVLGRWCCHPQWHTSMLNASKMAIFPTAKIIVQSLYHLLTDREKGRISEYYEINKT